MANTTLPNRKPGVKRPRGAKVVTAGDLNRVSPAQDPGLQATPSAFGELEAAGISTIGEAAGIASQNIQDRANKLAAAQARIQTKEERNAIRALKLEFERDLIFDAENLRTDEKLTGSKSLDKFRENTKNKMSAIQASFTGSPEGQLDLEFALQEVAGEAGVDFSLAVGEARTSQTNAQVNDSINRYLGDVENKNKPFGQQFVEFTGQYLEDFDEGLGREEQRVHLEVAGEVIATSAFNTAMDNLQFSEAEELLNSPAFQLSVPRKMLAQFQDRFNKKASPIERAKLEAAAVNAKADVFFPDDIGEHTSMQLHFAATGQLPSGFQVRSLKERKAELEALGVTVTDDMIKTMEGLIEKESRALTVLSPDQVAISQKGTQVGTGRTSEEIAQGLSAAGLGEKKATSIQDAEGNVKPVVTKRLESLAALRFGGDIVNGRLAIEDTELASFALNMIVKAEGILEAGTAKASAEAFSMALQLTDPADFPANTDLLSIANAPVTTEEIAEIKASAEGIKSNVEGLKASLESDAFKKIELEDATGIFSGMINAFAEIPGQFITGAVDPETVKARFQSSLFAREFVRAMMLNTRFALGEQSTIAGILSGPSAFKSPEAMRVKMKTFLANSKVRVAELKADLRRKQFNRLIPAEDKVQILKDIQTHQQLQRIIDKFELRPGGKGTPKPNTGVEFNALSLKEKKKVRDSLGQDGLIDLRLSNPDLFKAIEDTFAPQTQSDGGFPKGVTPGEPPTQKKSSKSVEPPVSVPRPTEATSKGAVEGPNPESEIRQLGPEAEAFRKEVSDFFAQPVKKQDPKKLADLNKRSLELRNRFDKLKELLELGK